MDYKKYSVLDYIKHLHTNKHQYPLLGSTIDSTESYDGVIQLGLNKELTTIDKSTYYINYLPNESGFTYRPVKVGGEIHSEFNFINLQYNNKGYKKYHFFKSKKISFNYNSNNTTIAYENDKTYAIQKIGKNFNTYMIEIWFGIDKKGTTNKLVYDELNGRSGSQFNLYVYIGSVIHRIQCKTNKRKDTELIINNKKFLVNFYRDDGMGSLFSSTELFEFMLIGEEFATLLTQITTWMKDNLKNCGIPYFVKMGNYLQDVYDGKI